MIDLHMKPDSHAPFAHYQIILAPQEVTIKNAETRVITTVIREGEFTVCYYCGHWVLRPRPTRCNCPASCHDAFDQAG